MKTLFLSAIFTIPSIAFAQGLRICDHAEQYPSHPYVYEEESVPDLVDSSQALLKLDHPVSCNDMARNQYYEAACLRTKIQDSLDHHTRSDEEIAALSSIENSLDELLTGIAQGCLRRQR